MNTQETRPARVAKWKTASVCLALAALVWIVFGQTLKFDFVNFDDNLNVYANKDVTSGLNARSVARAFTHSQIGHWDPLTTLSHILDCQWYGLHAGGHHLINVLLHCTSVVLLFLLLRGMTGAFWRSAFVAVVFAIHPLRAESVAWVSERKDTLSGLFFLLTIWAYWRYSLGGKRAVWYGVALLLFALGLMAKSMLVTLPFLLLLLDFWPLRRIKLPDGKQRFTIPRGLIFEKIPFLALSALSSVAALFADKGEVVMLNKEPFSWRAGNAAIGCATYLWQMVWPASLYVPYKRLSGIQPAWEISLAVLVLAVISAAVYLGRKKFPFLVTGWLWYLGMLVPVIGLVQVGLQAHADRYTYLPQIGVYIMIAWAAGELWGNHPRILGSVAVVMVTALAWRAYIQTSYWESDFTLWPHTLIYDDRSDIAHANYGIALGERGRFDESIAHFQKALQISFYPDTYFNYGVVLGKAGYPDQAMFQYYAALHGKPDYPEALNNLAHILQDKGRLGEAIVDYQKAIEINPDYAEAMNNLANALLMTGKIDQAVENYRRALQIKPDYAEALGNLGVAYAQKGEWDKAIDQYEKALELEPKDLKVLDSLSIAFAQKGNFLSAIAQYEKALAINPNYADAQGGLAYLLATAPDAQLRNGARAADLALKANQTAGGGDTDILDALAAAYAEQGRFSDAVSVAAQAARIAQAQGDAGSAARLQQHLKLYQTDTPLRDNR